jgi:hypothetical protein
VGLGNPWGQDRIRLANGVVIEALGTGGKIRGRRNRAQRPTLIVVDDPENDEHITSKRPMVSDSEDQADPAGSFLEGAVAWAKRSAAGP